MSGNVAKQAQDAVNLDRAIRMRVRGAHWNEIAAACGYSSPAAALSAVGKAMAAATQRAEETADQMRDTANLQLDFLLGEACKMIEAQTVMDENGNVADDRSVRLRAVDEARRLVADKVKLNAVIQSGKGDGDTDRIIIVGLDPDDVV